MGHLPRSGPGGMLEWLDKLSANTCIVLIYINNTNPILDEDSEERSVLDLHGIEVAYDDLEIEIQEHAGTMTMDNQSWSRDKIERRLREQGQAYPIPEWSRQYPSAIDL